MEMYIEGMNYSMNAETLSFSNKIKTIEIPKHEIMDILTGCADYARTYGLLDKYGREVDVPKFLQRL